jgi:hypothetical protein
MIEKVLQLKIGSGSHIYYGYSIQLTTNKFDSLYFNVYEKKKVTSGGWNKNQWLGLCNNFRLEFVYG